MCRALFLEAAQLHIDRHQTLLGPNLNLSIIIGLTFRQLIMSTALIRNPKDGLAPERKVSMLLQ
jgi:hypothetical protein